MITPERVILKNQSNLNITVIGAGIVGSSTALWLAEIGYKVTIIDPNPKKDNHQSKNLNGSQASLGILMGYVYRRTTGRSWRLRKRSMELWPKLIDQINTKDKSIKIDTPLVQLASSEEEFASIEKLVKVKGCYEIELLNKSSTEFFSDVLNKQQFGGLISHNDGRIEPLNILSSIISTLKEYDVTIIPEKVKSIKRSNQREYWDIYLNNNEMMKQDVIIICASLESEQLLKPLGHNIKLEPVLGQVLELRYEFKDISYKKWPAVLSSQGFNLIAKRDNQILIGATLEKELKASLKHRKLLHNMNGSAPDWIKHSSIRNHWYGIRAKPLDQPAPILKTLEPGLIINSGHYRNGILLAPACAEWVAQEINKTIK